MDANRAHKALNGYRKLRAHDPDVMEQPTQRAKRAWLTARKAS